MTDLRPKIKSVHTFPSEVEEMIRTIAAIRSEFLNQSPPMKAPLRMTIRDSWQRCAPLVEPGLSRAPVAVKSQADLNDLVLSNEPFLLAASPVIDRLTNMLSGSGYVIGLADIHGRLLKVNGDKITLRQVATLGLIPGGDWSESAVGTNGIGTALAVGHAVRVIGPEHLADGWQDYSCITVPIMDPWQGDIAGVLDITGDYHLLRPFFTGILSAAALEIRSNLKNLYSPYAAATRSSAIFIPARPAEKITPAQIENRAPAHKEFQHSQVGYRPQRSSTAERLAIATGVVGINLDIDGTLERVAEQAAYLFNLESAAVCLLEEQGNMEVIRSWSKIPARACDLQDSIIDIIKQSDAFRLLRESSEPLVIDNIRTSQRLSFKSLELRGIISLVLLPLIGPNGVKGALILPRPVPCSWHPDDLRLGLAFAFQSLSAIENARLYQNILLHHQHIETLNSVNQFLNSIVDPAQQLDLVVEQFVQLLNKDAGLILLHSGKEAEPCPLVQYGLRSPNLQDVSRLLDEKMINDGTVFYCRRTQQEYPITGVLQAVGLCDAIIVPLSAGVDRLGVLLVGYYNHTNVSDEDQVLVKNIGHQLGLALKNAQLLRSVAEAQVLRDADNIKNKFLLMVSHDLRSPLTAIRTSVECLLDKSAEPTMKSSDEMLKNIASQAKRLSKLVDGLLDLTKIEANVLKLDPDWTELGVLLADTIGKFTKMYFSRQIESFNAQDLPLLYVDPERIVQVFWNLLENAHKYSPPATKITVKAFLSEEQVFITVADQGPGIPVDEREKIFQYFYRMDRETQEHTPGSGLGLAICQGIVEAHGGRIWVAARPGGGSVFSVTLPISQPNTVNVDMLGNIETLATLPQE